MPDMTDPVAAGWEAVDDPGFIGLVGPIFRRGRDGCDEYGFVAAPKHANVRNVVQGGMLMTFADRAFGRTAWQAAGRGGRHGSVRHAVRERGPDRRFRRDPAGGRAPHVRARVHARHAVRWSAHHGDREWRVEDPGLRAALEARLP